MSVSFHLIGKCKALWKENLEVYRKTTRVFQRILLLYLLVMMKVILFAWSFVTRAPQLYIKNIPALRNMWFWLEKNQKRWKFYGEFCKLGNIIKYFSLSNWQIILEIGKTWMSELSAFLFPYLLQMSWQLKRCLWLFLLWIYATQYNDAFVQKVMLCEFSFKRFLLAVVVCSQSRLEFCCCIICLFVNRILQYDNIKKIGCFCEIKNCHVWQ